MSVDVYKEAKDAEDWGSMYYCVKVPKSLCTSEEIYVYADNIQVGESGDLNFLSYFDDGEQEEISLTIPNGKWNAVYLANKKHGTPMSVHRWTGEMKEIIIEQTIEVEKSSVIDNEKAEATIPPSSDEEE